MLFISPPFGNWVSLEKATSIRGSFTLEPRPGLVFQILKTLRYSWVHGGWLNRIGLRNKGLHWALQRYGTHEILSIAIMAPNEVPLIQKLLPRNQSIELNISCPNVDHVVSKGLSEFVNPDREWCIVKLSPLAKPGDVDALHTAGFRQFHCCNTLRTPDGALSGPSLIPYTSALVRYIHARYGNDSTIIAGGGVRDMSSTRNYMLAGADHISVSTLMFSPWAFMMFYARWIRSDESK